MGGVFLGNVRYISIYRIWVINKQVRCSTIQPLMFMLFYQKHEVFLCTHLVLTWVFNRGLQVQLLSKARPKWPRYRPHMARRSLLRVSPACIQFQLHLASFEVRDFFFQISKLSAIMEAGRFTEKVPWLLDPKTSTLSCALTSSTHSPVLKATKWSRWTMRLM